jgi:hypothetical protein
MQMCCVLLALLALVAPGAVVLDRIAVIVGRHVIKTSDIDREVRLTDFVNAQPLDLSTAARKKAADRLIDQDIIRNEVEVAGYATASAADADKLLAQMKANRFRSDAQYRAALRQYGITEEQLKAQLLWQLTVLRFIEQRFRPGVLVSDEDVRKYYDTHAVELRKTSGGNSSMEALRPKIQEILAGEQVNEQFFAWLDQSRKQLRIQFRDDAFQ